MSRRLLLLFIVTFGFGTLAGGVLVRTLFKPQIEQRIEVSVGEALRAREEAESRQPPTLVAPEPDARFDNLAAVRLEWNWARPLADDEYFDVRVWRPGEPPYGITWTKDNYFELRDWLLGQEQGEFYWTVTVVKAAEDGSPQELTDIPPEVRFYTGDAKLDLLQVPEGFSADLVARFPFYQPTVVTFDPKGDLYVLGAEGVLAQMLDDDGDGYYEGHRIVYENADGAVMHAVGLAFRGDEVYLSHQGQVSKFRDDDGDGVFDGYTVLVDGLPTWEQVFHSNNGIAFGPDDKLYIAVGSTTDHGPLRHPLEASILRMNPDGSELEVFATGLRNPYDLVFTPDGELFTADNSPDEMDQRLPYLPPEELNHIREGRNYGFPDAYGIAGAMATRTERPVTEFFSSVATSGLTYYAADAYPEAYKGIYVAQFGTGAPFPQSRGIVAGREVVHVRLEPDGQGSYTGEWETFASLDSDYGLFSPIDVTVGPDGNLYIAEWITATLFRVTYTGENLQTQAEIRDDMQSEAAMIFQQGISGVPACSACHTLETNTPGVGPSLYAIETVAADRVPELNAREYIRQSIVNPSAYVVDGYAPGVMYSGYADALSEAQVEALVSYLLERRSQR